MGVRVCVCANYGQLPSRLAGKKKMGVNTCSGPCKVLVLMLLCALAIIILLDVNVRPRTWLKRVRLEIDGRCKKSLREWGREREREGKGEKVSPRASFAN